MHLTLPWMLSGHAEVDGTLTVASAHLTASRSRWPSGCLRLEHEQVRHRRGLVTARFLRREVQLIVVLLATDPEIENL